MLFYYSTSSETQLARFRIYGTRVVWSHDLREWGKVWIGETNRRQTQVFVLFASLIANSGQTTASRHDQHSFERTATT